MVVVADDGFWLAVAAVCWQAGLASGDMAVLCANAEADSAIPIATEAEKMNRDIRSSKISHCLALARGPLICDSDASKTACKIAISRFVIDN